MGRADPRIVVPWRYQDILPLLLLALESLWTEESAQQTGHRMISPKLGILKTRVSEPAGQVANRYQSCRCPECASNPAQGQQIDTEKRKRSNVRVNQTCEEKSQCRKSMPDRSIPRQRGGNIPNA
ncbi:hypothetical protein GGR57DRAFT_5779 [Xylariaceae sp. FL1272]|nr:hypothetical protein GGR57DRAFT_5779 [Xylariaceae sp. FL1272]